MASVKVKFRPSKVTGREGTIYYQIIHDRKPRQLHTEYRIMSDEWDAHRSSLIIGRSCKRKSLLLSMRKHIHCDMERLMRIISRLDGSGLEYTADDIINEFNRYSNDYSLFNFTESIIAKLKQNGRIRTSEAYISTLHSFRKFRKGEDIMLDSLTSEIMEAYEAWLYNRRVVPNTVSFYTRILRAVYNRAVEDNIIENRSPFRHVFTRIDKTVKRALPIPILREIKNLDLSPKPALEYARDMFIMSFYLRGMSFIDMAFLKNSDLKNGYITYRRHKTGQLLIIEWTKEMQLLLDKYPANKSEYLLPIIRNPGTNERCLYRNAAYRINHCLKTIAEKVGISVPLTLYVARHSWASAAKAKGIPISVISEGMGHSSEVTTQIYLASLDTSVVDRANHIIIKSL